MKRWYVMIHFDSPDLPESVTYPSVLAETAVDAILTVLGLRLFVSHGAAVTRVSAMRA